MSRLSEDYAAVKARLVADCRTAFEIGAEGDVHCFPNKKVAFPELVVIERGGQGIEFLHDTPTGSAVRLSFRVTAFKRRDDETDCDTEKVRLLHAFHDLFCVKNYADQGAGSDFRGAWRSLVTSALSEVDDPQEKFYTVDVDCECWIAVSRGDAP